MKNRNNSLGFFESHFRKFIFASAIFIFSSGFAKATATQLSLVLSTTSYSDCVSKLEALNQDLGTINAGAEGSLNSNNKRRAYCRSHFPEVGEVPAVQADPALSANPGTAPTQEPSNELVGQPLEGANLGHTASSQSSISFGSSQGKRGASLESEAQATRKISAFVAPKPEGQSGKPIQAKPTAQNGAGGFHVVRGSNIPLTGGGLPQGKAASKGTEEKLSQAGEGSSFLPGSASKSPADAAAQAKANVPGMPMTFSIKDAKDAKQAAELRELESMLAKPAPGGAAPMLSADKDDAAQSLFSRVSARYRARFPMHFPGLSR